MWDVTRRVKGKGDEEVVDFTTSSSAAMVNRECFFRRRENEAKY
jgi:hypothetical protein